MPIQFPEDGGACAVFTARCVPEEGDALLDWLRRTPDAEADLSSCTDLHTALAQLLFAGRVRLAAPPNDVVLAGCLHAAGLAPAPIAAPTIAAPTIAAPTVAAPVIAAAPKPQRKPRKRARPGHEVQP
jgi:hypothetical protein